MAVGVVEVGVRPVWRGGGGKSAQYKRQYVKNKHKKMAKQARDDVRSLSLSLSLSLYLSISLSLSFLSLSHSLSVSLSLSLSLSLSAKDRVYYHNA